MGVVHSEVSNWILSIFHPFLEYDMPVLNSYDNEASKKEQKFLDTSQYSRNGITRYEEIFGKTFVSVGGETTTREFVTMIGLAPDMKVLDIGSGAGGSAFYMARNYKVNVHGIDLSTNMNGISLDYRKEMEPDVKHRCNFYIEDADKMEFPENFFDVVYSRDTIMHFKDEERRRGGTTSGLSRSTGRCWSRLASRMSRPST